MTSDNPLLQSWTTLYELPPFDLIRDDHFMPAYHETMAAHRVEIDATAGNQEPPTFANTIEAIEQSGFLLQRISDVFHNLASTNLTLARRDIERQISPLIAEHYMAIYTNDALFQRVKVLYDNADTLGLTTEQQQLLERYYKHFVKKGAALDADQKVRATAISARLAELATSFSQNVLKDETDFQLFLEDADALDGLPDFLIEATAQTATDRGQKGKHVVTLARASIEPFLQFSKRRDLRKQAYEAYIARGQMNATTNNQQIIKEILTLRREWATLLGFANYADFRLDQVMAKTPSHARHLLDTVWPFAKAKAIAEQKTLEDLAQQDGINEPIKAWDWHYYTEKQRAAAFDIDSAALKPYFQLDNMIVATFDTATRLFGLSFAERTDLPIYHKDLRIWEVSDKSGVIGLFVGDYFQRQDKRGNAWMTSLRRQSRMNKRVLPIIVNVLNFTKGADGKPSLLSIDDAETLFHEFGHGLHGLLSNVTYQSLAGTNVDRDFVELPSQIYENWLYEPQTLSRFALHAETSEPIPTELIDKVIAAQTFNQGFATAEYVASALIDLDLHEADLDDDFNIDTFEMAMRQRLEMPNAIALRHRPAHFQHIFAGDGYAAGYYTYMWAEVMEADAFTAFKDTGNVYDPDMARKLHRYIYSSGGSMKPEQAYVAFRGRDPDFNAMMKQRGFDQEAGIDR